MGFLASANLSGASGSAPLPGFLNSLAGPLDHYGYWAIALLLLLENIGVPVVPGELALIAGAIFAGTGRAGLNVVLVGVVAVIVVIVGAEIGYLIGRFAGRELVLRYGKYVLIKPHHLDRAEAVVSRYGGDRGDHRPVHCRACARPTGSSPASPRCAGSPSWSTT